MSARSDRLRAAIAARLARILFLRSGRRTEDRLILFGGAVGNLAALALELRSTRPTTEIAVLLARRSSPRPGIPALVLRPWRLRDLLVVSRSRAVVTSQGPGVLRTWLSAKHRPLFVDVWHGVGFKSRILTARPEFRVGYDAHFVSSPFVADFYRRAGARAIVTGYGRMDALVAGRTDGEVAARLDSLFGDIDGPLVLVAPTWGIERSVSDEDALAALAAVAQERGARIAYRPHAHAPTVDVASWPRVRLLGPSVVAVADDLLPHVAVLVTDWSSIATDFLPLAAPVVYIDAPRPATTPGPLTEHDRPGPVARTPEELADSVRAAIDDPGGHLATYASAREATVERAWSGTLDGHSATRYIEAIERLEEDRREEAGQ